MMLILWILGFIGLLVTPLVLIYLSIMDDLVKYPFTLEDQIEQELKGENL